MLKHVQVREYVRDLIQNLPEGAPAPSERTFAMAQQFLESVTVVSDHDAIDAAGFLLERLKILAEPAASCTFAAATRLQGQFTAGKHVVLLLSGGNTSLDALLTR